jgi:hypothetical protein
MNNSSYFILTHSDYSLELTKSINKLTKIYDIKCIILIFKLLIMDIVFKEVI